MPTIKQSLLKLSAPNIAANIATPLLGIVDTWLMGHAEGLYMIGAIAIGGMIFNCLYWSFGFLRMGTSGMTAQAYGANNYEESISILGRALLCALVIALVILLFQNPIRSLAFQVIGGSSPEILQHAGSYYDTRIWAAPATLCLYAFGGWFLGMQNAMWPLFFAILSNVINMLLSFYFVRWQGMGTEGVALGTVLAQYLTLIACFIVLRCRFQSSLSQFNWTTLKHIDRLKDFFTVNRDIFIRTILLIAIVSFFTAYSAQFGEVALAANSLLVQFAALMAFAVDGIANGAESLVGKFIGAKDRGSLRKVIQLSFKWGMAVGLFFALLYLFAGETILSLFTDKADIIATGKVYLWWAVIACLINPICFIWDGVFIGAAMSQAMRNSMLFSAILIYIPAFFIGHEWANHGHWFAMTLFMISRGVSMTVLGRKLLREN
jgi:multidrug resistance protein, MATE family